MTITKQFKLNLPADVKRWVQTRAAANMRSQSAEIVFALKEKMQMTAGEQGLDTAPAVINQNSTLQGAHSITKGMEP